LTQGSGRGTCRWRSSTHYVCGLMLTLSASLFGWISSESFFSTTAAFETSTLQLLNPVSGIFIFDVILGFFTTLSLDLLFASDAQTISEMPAFKSKFSKFFYVNSGLFALLNRQLLDTWTLSAEYALLATQFTQKYSPLNKVFETLDPFLFCLELVFLSIVLALFLVFSKQRFFLSQGYVDLITFCQHRNISVVEVFSVLTFFLGFIFFDVFVTLAEDDVLEAISYVFLIIIILAVLLLILAVDIQYYYLISSISGGELTLRLLYADIVNNILCLLRIFFC
jgi:hypothetical protein